MCCLPGSLYISVLCEGGSLSGLPPAPPIRDGLWAGPAGKEK